MALQSLGITNPPLWTSSLTWAMPSIILMSVWTGAGYYMIIFLAALKNIPSSLYESAELDGARAVQQFIHVTLPMISPATFFATIIAIINSFKVFDQVLLADGGRPGQGDERAGLFHLPEQLQLQQIRVRIGRRLRPLLPDLRADGIPIQGTEKMGNLPLLGIRTATPQGRAARQPPLPELPVPLSVLLDALRLSEDRSAALRFSHPLDTRKDPVEKTTRPYGAWSNSARTTSTRSRSRRW